MGKISRAEWILRKRRRKKGGEPEEDRVSMLSAVDENQPVENVTQKESPELPNQSQEPYEPKPEVVEPVPAPEPVAEVKKKKPRRKGPLRQRPVDDQKRNDDYSKRDKKKNSLDDLYNKSLIDGDFYNEESKDFYEWVTNGKTDDLKSLPYLLKI